MSVPSSLAVSYAILFKKSGNLNFKNIYLKLGVQKLEVSKKTFLLCTLA